MANKQRGELDLHIGGQTRTLRFRTEEMLALEDRLGMDVLAYFAAQRGQTKFLVEALFCGFSKTEKKISPMRVAKWLDDDTKPITIDGKPARRDDIIKEILYAIARGKPEEESNDMIEVFDEMFKDDKEEDSASSPLESGLQQRGNTMNSSGLPPNLA